MTMQIGTSLEQELFALQRDLTALRQQIDRMRVGVTGRELLGRGALVVPLGTAARTDTDSVRKGTVNFYTSGATIIMQVYSGTAWRSVTLA